MTLKQLDDYIKKQNENLDSAVKIIEMHKELLKEKEQLKEKLNAISMYIRERIYSFNLEDDKTINRLDLSNEEYEKLMNLIEKEKENGKK